VPVERAGEARPIALVVPAIGYKMPEPLEKHWRGEVRDSAAVRRRGRNVWRTIAPPAWTFA